VVSDQWLVASEPFRNAGFLALALAADH
jgi:hypothetical protein